MFSAATKQWNVLWNVSAWYFHAALFGIYAHVEGGW